MEFRIGAPQKERKMLKAPTKPAAIRVLTFINELGVDTDKHLLMVEHYCNCREQGYAVINLTNDKQAVFSESRNSDSTVLYTGDRAEFERNTNIPNESCYVRAQFFKFAEDLKVAEAVCAFLGIL